MDMRPKFYFFQGSTPTLEFILPIELDVNDGDVVIVTLAQNHQTIKEYDQDDTAVTVEGGSVYVHMTQDDTLKFETGDVLAQLRYLLKDGTADVSCPIHGYVEATQKLEVIRG